MLPASDENVASVAPSGSFLDAWDGACCTRPDMRTVLAYSSPTQEEPKPEGGMETNQRTSAI